MDIAFPKYYRNFRCIAGACPDSCCKEWAVDVDPETTQFYRNLPGQLGDELRAVLEDSPDGTVITIRDGRCPMWQSDGLCRIQVQLGHEALCKTCREFPRLRHDYGNFIELGLELSCPVAAQLILSEPSSEMCCESLPGGEEPAYDAELMVLLQKSRKIALRFLESRTYPLPHTLAILLLYAHNVQAQIDGDAEVPFVPEDYLQEARHYTKAGDIRALIRFFAGLEILTPQWKKRLDNPPLDSCWTDTFRAFVIYGIQRYWLQAISDLELLARVKLVLASTLLVHTLGGDVIQTAQLFSKEVENDPENIDAILEGAYSDPGMADENLFSLFLR